MAKQRETVLITGLPCLQARGLLQLILEAEPQTDVVGVVLSKRLDLVASLVDALPAKHRRRVTLLEGDAAAIDLGLSGSEYRDLAGRVTRIHHTAHVSWVGVDRQTAEQVNIQGAVEMVELGRAAERLRCIVHHSSAHVSGARTGVVYEDELDMGQGFHSVVQESRMKAEKVMRRAMEELPITVVRPTMLVGDSITGEVERLDGPYQLVMVVLGLPDDLVVPLPSFGDSPVDIVPVDYVARAAHAIGLNPKAIGQTFHLASQEGLTARQLFDLIAEAGKRRVTARNILPPQIASALMSTPGINRFIQEPRAFIQQISTPARYDTRNTRRLLADSDIRCPPVAKYVGTWVTVVNEHLRQRRERQQPFVVESGDLEQLG